MDLVSYENVEKCVLGGCLQKLKSKFLGSFLHQNCGEHTHKRKKRGNLGFTNSQDGKIFFSKNSYCLATFSSDPKRKTILNFLTELIPCFMCIIQTYTYQFLKISLQKFSESTFPFPRFFAQLFLMKVFILPVILTPASKVFFKKRTKSNTSTIIS